MDHHTAHTTTGLAGLVLPQAFHHFSMTRLALSPEGASLASINTDGTLRVWDTATGELRACLPLAITLLGLAWSPDGRTIAVTHSCMLILLDAHNLRERLRVGHEIIGEDSQLAFHPGSELLAIVNTEAIVLMDPQLGTKKARRRVTSPCTSLTFSPDGDCLYVGHQDGRLTVHETTRGQEIRWIAAQEGAVSAVAIHPGGQILATGGEETGQLKLWQTASLFPIKSAATHPFLLEENHHGILALAFSPDGASLVSSSNEGTARVWAVRPESPEPLVLEGILQAADSCVYSVVLSPDSERLYLGHCDGVVSRHERSTGERLPTPALHERSFSALALSPDGSRVALTGDDAVSVWELHAPFSFVAYPLENFGRTLAFSPDGTYLACLGTHDQITVFCLADGQQAGCWISQEETKSLRWQADGLLATISARQERSYSPKGKWESTKELAGPHQEGAKKHCAQSVRCGQVTATVNEGERGEFTLRREKSGDSLRLGCLILGGESLPFALSARGFFDADPRLLPHFRLIAPGKLVSEESPEESHTLLDRHRPGLFADFLASPARLTASRASQR